MTSARQFLEDLKGDVKVFSSTHGNGPGKPAGSLKDIQAAQQHAEAAQQHAAMSAEHEGLSAENREQGNRSIAGMHADAAEAHSSLAATHTDLAAAHAQKAKTGVKPLGEGFAAQTRDAKFYYDADKYNMQTSAPIYDNPRPKHTNASVQDLRNCCNMIAAKYSARVELVRNLGDDVGFVAGLVLQPGLYLGQTAPSIGALEAELVAAVRNVSPVAIVDLITADEVPQTSGPNARRGIFRFRLRDLHRGDLGGP